MSLMSLLGRRSLRRAFVGLVLSLCILSLATDGLAQLKDAAGSKDHPMVKRFEGSAIIGYEFLKFNDLVVLLGPVKGKYSQFEKWEFEHGRSALPLAPTKSQRVEGEATRILYVAPMGRSPLEILRNYERELQRLGFQTLFKCAREACSEQDGALGWLYLYIGGYEHNMGLSQRRAEAVVKELTTKHGIPATRLKAAGTGPLAPMAPNETEEGRAKNRRVELVKQ